MLPHCVSSHLTYVVAAAVSTMVIVGALCERRSTSYSCRRRAGSPTTVPTSCHAAGSDSVENQFSLESQLRAVTALDRSAIKADIHPYARRGRASSYVDHFRSEQIAKIHSLTDRTCRPVAFLQTRRPLRPWLHQRPKAPFCAQTNANT